MDFNLIVDAQIGGNGECSSTFGSWVLPFDFRVFGFGYRDQEGFRLVVEALDGGKGQRRRDQHQRREKARIVHLAPATH